VPISKLQPGGTLVKALARPYRWHRVLENGEYGTSAEPSAAEQISRSYVCRVLRLTLLAPDVERVMDGAPTARLALRLEPSPSDGRGSGRTSPDDLRFTMASSARAMPVATGSPPRLHAERPAGKRRS
jgi:hypothetical protein